MKKRLWAIPCMLMAAMCLALLSACGGPSVEELIREDLTTAFEEISPEDENLVNAMVDSSGDGFDQLGIDPQDFATEYLDGFEYEIKDIAVDEEAGTAEATVAVKMKSLTAIMSKFGKSFQEFASNLDVSSVQSEEEVYAQAGELLMDAVGETEPSETDCVFTYTKAEDNSWSATEDTETEILKAMQ